MNNSYDIIYLENGNVDLWIFKGNNTDHYENISQALANMLIKGL